MATAKHLFPASLQAACDEAIAAYMARKAEPESFTQVTDWLEGDVTDEAILFHWQEPNRPKNN
jgi:hypothetical protein